MKDLIEEAYVSFEVAKLLKEKGFDEEILSFYIPYEDGEVKFVVSPNKANYNAEQHWLISAPTHQMAMGWLREKGVYITIVYGDYPSLNKVFWTPQIDSLEGFDFPDSFYKEYNKYEEAVEAALKYVLENLI